MRLVGWRRGPPRLAEAVAIEKEEVGEAFSHSPIMRETPRDDYCRGPGAVVPSASNQYDPDPNRPGESAPIKDSLSRCADFAPCAVGMGRGVV